MCIKIIFILGQKDYWKEQRRSLHLVLVLWDMSRVESKQEERVALRYLREAEETWPEPKTTASFVAVRRVKDLPAAIDAVTQAGPGVFVPSSTFG